LRNLSDIFINQTVSFVFLEVIKLFKHSIGIGNQYGYNGFIFTDFSRLTLP
jgi:hypothetical protein